MDLVGNHSQTKIITKDAMYKANLMEKVNMNGKMVQFMKVNLFKDIGKERE